MELENRRIASVAVGICVIFTSMAWMFMRIPQYEEKLISNSEWAPWLLYGYIIAEVSMVVLAGVMVDKYGPKNTLLIGLPFYIGGSLGVYASQDLTMMVIYRIIQGIGAGFIFTVSVAMVPKVYDKSERADPHKIMTLTFALGSIFGTAVGRYFIIELHNWRVFFIICAVVVLICGIIGYLTLPDIGGGHLRDIPGAVLVVATVAAVMTYTQMVNENFNLVSFESIAFLELCIVLFFLLIFVEKKAKDPLLPKGITRSHYGLMACMFLAGFCGLGMLQFLTMFIIVYYKLSILNATCMLLCLIGGGAVTSLIGMKVVYKIGIRPLTLIGPALIMFAFMCGFFLLERGLFGVGTMLFLMGLGFGAIVTEMLLSIQATSKWKDTGAYSGLLMSMRFVGIIFGMAVYNHLIIVPVKEYIHDVKGESSVIDIFEWLLNHMYECYDAIINIFEEAVKNCCIIAGITVLSVLVISYLLVGKDDLDMPERNE